MKKLFTILFAFVLSAGAVQAQTIDELKAQKASLDAARAEAQAKADALSGEIGGLQKEIDILSGWRTGLAGLVGFNLDKQSNWIQAANPNSSATGLGINVDAFANKMTDKTIWNTSGLIRRGWQTINTTGGDGVSLFDSTSITKDVLNVASLYGYRVHPKVAISALGELGTSTGSFLKPGVIDIGVGATWTPNPNLVVVVHPFNYHLAFAGLGSPVESSGALGAKVRAEYKNSYTISGREIKLNSTFTSFAPYSGTKELTNAEGNLAGLFEYTWQNNISFEIWNGIGVGVGFGLRKADFETSKTQSQYNFGLSYAL